MDTAELRVRNNTSASMSNETIELLSFLQIHEEEKTHIFWSFGIIFFSGLFVVNFCFICFNSVFL
jgi:hypothetical protein